MLAIKILFAFEDIHHVVRAVKEREAVVYKFQSFYHWERSRTEEGSAVLLLVG